MQKLSAWDTIRILWITLFHPRTRFSTKALVFGAALYDAFPIDFIPDIIPLLGMVDDSMITIIAILVFLHETKELRKEIATRFTRGA